MNQIKPNHHDPKNFTAEEHHQLVIFENTELREAVRNLLNQKNISEIVSKKIQELLTNSNHPVQENLETEILIAGSDAREEKGASSQLELIILYDNPNWIHNYFNLVEILNGHIGQGVIDDKSELKALGSNKIHLFRGNESQPYPSRIFDAIKLTESPKDLLNSAKQELEKIILTDGKSILETKRQRLKKFRQISKTGSTKEKSGIKTHFDLIKGEAYMDKTEYICSFKYGPIRQIQTWTTMQLIKTIRSESRENRPSIIHQIPNSTVEKIQFLEQFENNKSIIPHKSALQQLYIYFLHLYHISEHDYHFNNSRTTTFDIKQTKEAINLLQSIDETLNK